MEDVLQEDGVMCECLDPVRHSCGGFGQFDGIRGQYDFYRCAVCGVRFSVPCKLVDLGPLYMSMRNSLEVSLKGGDLIVSTRAS